MDLTRLKQIPLLSELSNQQLRSFLKQTKILTLKENTELFHQGDTSNAMYILVSGGLISMLEHDDSSPELIGAIHVGETVGEIGLLTTKSRTLTVKAIEESVVIEITQQVFINLISNTPKITQTILKQLLTRSHKAIAKKTIAHSKLIVAFSANENIKLNELIKQIIDIADKKKTIIIDNNKLQDIYIKNGLLEAFDYVNTLRSTYDSVVFFNNDKILEDKIIQLVIQQADSIVVVASGQRVPYLSKALQSILEKTYKTLSIHHNAVRFELVLMWPTEEGIKNTIQWLKTAQYNSHYHVIADEPESYRRLLRFWNGKAICVVLGAGATRCWAHIGLLSALQDNDVIIDAIIGCSSGAGIAATYSTTQNINKLINLTGKISEAMKETISFPSFITMPISIYNTNKITRCFQKIFKLKQIENSKIPLVVLSSNINKMEEVIHQYGDIWKYVMSSSSIPGLLPPVVDNNNLLIDGGAMNTLPVNHAKRIFGSNIVVIASDLDSFSQDQTKYNYPTELSWRKLLSNKVSRYVPNYVFPTISTILYRSTTIGSMVKYKENIKLADHYIRHDVSNYSLMEFDIKTRNKLIELGYKTTAKYLKNNPKPMAN